MLHSDMGVMLLRGTKPCASRPGDEGSAPTAACSIGCSAELASSSLRMLMGEMVSSQLVIPKSLRWALAWLESPARVSKPAPQNSHRIRLNVLGSKLATAERRTESEAETPGRAFEGGVIPPGEGDRRGRETHRGRCRSGRPPHHTYPSSAGFFSAPQPIKTKKIESTVN